MALSILAFNIASTNVYIQRGLERSRLHAIAVSNAYEHSSVAINHSIDKSANHHHLSLTISVAGISAATFYHPLSDRFTAVQNSILKISFLEDPCYSSFKPPRFTYSI